MTIKELSQLYWLNREIETDQKRLDDLAKEIRTLQQRLASLRQKASEPSGTSLTGIPNTSGYDNRIERYIGDIDDLERLIAEKRKTLSEYAMAIHARQMLVIHERNGLERYINGIEDGYMRKVFYHRFIDGENWAQIAARLEKDGATEDSVKKRFYRYARKAKLL